MGEYTAANLPPLTKCLNDVAACDVYVGIVAFRYGALPPGSEESYVELEFNRAREYGKPTLVFIRNQDALDGIDLGARIERFRQKLLRQEGWTACIFKSKEELVDRVAEALRVVSPPPSPKGDCLIKVGRLPETPPDLFGREAEIKRLNEAWSDERTNVFCLWGLGGTGKSSLLNYWLNDFLTAQGHRGAKRILGWSFYAGASSAGAASADSFMDLMFQWLREEVASGVDPLEAIKIPGDPWQKGTRLAELIQEKKTLLILDGFEAVGEKTSENTGVLNDVAMKALLRSLAAHNPGLCLITSRLRIEELQTFRNQTAKELHLSQLSPEAGVELLESLGVHGPHAELVNTVNEYGGHAFSLRAVGNLLKKYCRGDVSDRMKLPPGVPSLKRIVADLLRWYETSFGEGPELDVLRMLSVFRGPAFRRALDALRAEPAIHGLTDHVTGLSDLEWNAAVNGLVELELVTESRGSLEAHLAAEGAELLDTHALVREHFSQQLHIASPRGWLEANNRLFEYYRSLAPDRPDDFPTMLPLFRAVAHGCQAGRHQEAWDEVEWKRIRRGDEGFCVVSLGAWGEDLVALTNFFESCWDRPAPALDKRARAWLLTETAFDLRGLGRLSDAVRPLTAGLAEHKANEDWWAACDAAGNLSELLTLWGDLAKANSAANQSIELAVKAVKLAVGDKANQGSRTAHDAAGNLSEVLTLWGDLAKPDFAANESIESVVKLAVGDKDIAKAAKTLFVNIATLAEVQHQQGLLDSAEKLFRTADRLYAAVAGVKCIHGARGFHFSDLLLDLGKTEEVEWRAPATLETDKAEGRRYGVGLARLLQAQFLMERFRTSQITDLSAAQAKLQEAYDSLTEAGFQPYVIRARLAMGSLNLLSGHFDQALSDIDKALDAADRGQMRLLYIDGQLEKARALFTLNKLADARDCVEAASREARIKGYHRRDGVVAALLKQYQTLKAPA